MVLIVVWGNSLLDSESRMGVSPRQGDGEVGGHDGRPTVQTRKN